MRNLTQHEIGSLLANGCVAEDWTQIFVSEQFSPAHVANVRFSGRITMGCFERIFVLEGGLSRHSGLRNATLHNCEIGDNVFIENVANHISNYRIENDCYIQNVDVITVDKRSAFGNGVRVSVLNETGGREVPIYNELSSSLAYIIALYRHKKKAIDELCRLIDNYAEKQSSAQGIIGPQVKILNAGTIKQVNIGAYARIENATRLENGTLVSNKQAPVYVGDSVIASDFIISSGAYIADAAKIIRCFIGQACHISHNFSAHDSLIFANGNFENGEACAIFAGPFTVSMHKSSLLIAGMFSFLNAGSGSNQSNHLYKLGPIHQGIVERGSKTTSDSYVLWPARIGAFSLIMGRHYHHSDTTNIPFSYLVEHADESFLIPAVNLRSVGTIRDAQKWPKRDKRTDLHRLDPINYNLLSPYTIQKMLKGRQILINLREMSGETTDVYTYRNTKIKNAALRNGINLYDKAIIKFLGNSLISRIQNHGSEYSSLEQIRQKLQPTHALGTGDWVDLSGLFIPKTEVDLLISLIESRKITLSEISNRFATLHADYYDMEWTWVYPVIEHYFNISLPKVTVEQLTAIIEQWRDAVITLDKMLYKDAMKEFSMTSMIGFGVDGSEIDKLDDFESVRGAFDSDPFVESVQHHIEAKSNLADKMLKTLQQLA